MIAKATFDVFSSDEGPALLRNAGYRGQPEPTRDVYPKTRKFHEGPQAPRMMYQRPRANSDGTQRRQPARIYTDREIEIAGGERPFNDENFPATNLGNGQPISANIPHAKGTEEYDRILEANLPAADQWGRRPRTPY